MTTVAEAADLVSQIHGRGAYALAIAVSAVAFLLLTAIAANVRRIADRMPWNGRSSNPVQQRDVLTWNRLGCGFFAVIALVVLIRVVATRSL